MDVHQHGKFPESKKKEMDGEITKGKRGKSKIKVWSSKKKSEPEQVIIQRLQSQYSKIDSKSIKYFNDFPLSDATKRGLRENGYSKPTEIQRESIGLSLKGQDVLGAAKTGSGKTLAFLIPVLEILYCKQWTRLDGTGALIITPTRELAYQIFETLRKIGHYHDFSAGLIIGGKDLKFERSRMDQVNIIICTPGRLLQHMDENPLFDCSKLQILILDEADRILDLGFQQTMNSIIVNLPPQRQTLLFSATQTKSVRDLARLSLNDPMYVSVHEHAAHSTPELLAQSYLVCNLEEKISVLYSFIRNHLKHKVIVFMSSCKQVKYVFETFCQLRPGVSLLALYGTLHQMRRMKIYEDFCRKSRVVLFATDVAARGLDFPAVNWVVQLDCPEDADTYIHRAGRTARFQKSGESLLVLLPSEKDGMLKRLEDRKIPIKEIKVNPEKLQNPNRKLEAFLARSAELKATAQRAFISYIKSVALMKDKEVFNVQALNTDEFARSLGLAIPPKIRFLQRRMQKEKEKEKEGGQGIQKLASGKKSAELKSKEVEDKNDESDDSSESENAVSEESNEDDELDVKLKNDANGNKSSSGFNFGGDGESDDDVLTVKRRNHELSSEIAPLTEEELSKQEGRKCLTKAAIAKKAIKKKIQLNKKVVYDEDGQALIDPKTQKVSALAQEYDKEDESGINIEKAKAVLKEEDRFDKERFRERIRAKHREAKRKAKPKKGEDEDQKQDEFSSGDESSGPDLSWLPDPDKYYEKKSGDEDGSDDGSDSVESNESDDSDHADHNDTRELSRIPVRDGGSSESEEEESPPPRLKRKLKNQEGKLLKKKRTGKEALDGMLDTGLSLQEDEELALKFLQAKRSL